MNGALIYLFGFAGCGKLTIAQAIQARYDCMLVDSHYVNNVIFSLIEPDGKTRLPDSVWEYVRRARGAVFDTIRHLAKPGRSFLFTNALMEGDEGAQKLFLEVAEIARHRNAFFLPVRLTIAPAELARRVASRDRAARLKESDPEAALLKARNHEVLRPQGVDYLEIDVTPFTAEEVAERIVTHLKKQMT